MSKQKVLSAENYNMCSEIFEWKVLQDFKGFAGSIPCKKIVAPLAWFFPSQVLSRIFMYVIVPLSSVVAKETQILLLTRGELLVY